MRSGHSQHPRMLWGRRLGWRLAASPSGCWRTVGCILEQLRPGSTRAASHGTRSGAASCSAASGSTVSDSGGVLASRSGWRQAAAVNATPRLLDTRCAAPLYAISTPNPPWPLRRWRSSTTAPLASHYPSHASTQATMRDYYRLKQEYPDHLLLYQKGSFYELFGADAVRASEELPLRRSEVTGMVGFPMHRSSHWIPVFHRAGFTLAIADQVKIPDPRNPGRSVVFLGVVQPLASELLCLTPT